MKNLYFLVLLFVPFLTLGQITITHSDYENAFAIGKSYKSYATPTQEMISVFVGSASTSPQEWDFTGYEVNHVSNSTSVQPSQAPFFNQFPNTNICLYGKTFEITADTLENYQYMRLEPDKLQLLALSDETAVLLEYDPPAQSAVVPVQLGSEWMLERDSIYIMQNTWTIGEGWVTVDAFGTFKLPSGTYPCLRFTINHLSIVHTPFGVDTTRTRTYHFYSTDLTEVHLTTILEPQFNNTTIDIAGFNYSVPSGSSGTAEPGPINAGILGIAPNPVSHTGTLRYHLDEASVVNIQLCNIEGKIVRQTGWQRQPVGTNETMFSVESLPDGLYTCIVRTEKTVYLKKIVVQ